MFQLGLLRFPSTEGQLSEQFSCTKYRPDSTQGKNRTTMGNIGSSSVLSNVTNASLGSQEVFLNNVFELLQALVLQALVLALQLL